MFANLIESASHQHDLARKGRFFLATLISYALIVACAGLASIYAYDANMDEKQDLEFLGLVPPIVPDQVTPETPRTTPRSSTNNGQRSTVTMRTDAIDRVAAPTKVPDTISSISSSVPEVPIDHNFVIGSRNVDASIDGPPSDKNRIGSGTGGGPLVRIETPPPANNASSAQPKEVIKSGGVLNGKAIFLPKPEYSAIAKATRASGPVSVQVLIDESGKVISARASSGNPLLTAGAVRSAYQTRFSPTLLSGVPVKVSGVINYNFSLQ